MITVRLADGREIQVDTTDPQQAAKVAHSFGQSNPHPEATTKNELAGVAGHYLDGMLPGASGFVRGTREAIVNAAQAPFSDKVDFHPLQSYHEGQAFQEARSKMAERDHPTASGVASGAGIAAGVVLPASKIAKGATMGQKMLAGAKTAGGYGLLSGAMSSKAEDLMGKAGDAVSSGLTSLAVGGVAPLALRGAGALAKPFKPFTYGPLIDLAGKGMAKAGPMLPGRLGRMVADEGAQLSRDPIKAAANVAVDHDLRAAPNSATGRNWTPMEVATEVRRRQAMGVPAAPADVHESARRSFGAATRSPGPATAAVRQAIDKRQAESTARMAGHIADTLGPTTNVEAQADLLNRQGREAAAPLYDISNAQHVPYVKELQELMSRPDASDALQQAGRMMRNEGMRPSKLGIVESKDGIFSMGRTPKPQAYDYVKTALDSSVGALENPLASSHDRRAARGSSMIRSRLLELMDGDGSGPRIPQPGSDIMPQTPPGSPMAPPANMRPQDALPGQPRLPEPPPRPAPEQQMPGAVQGQQMPQLTQGEPGVHLPPLDLPKPPPRMPLDAPAGPVNPMPEEASQRAMVPYEAPGLPGGAGSTPPALYEAPGVPGGHGSTSPALYEAPGGPGGHGASVPDHLGGEWREVEDPFDFGQRLHPEEDVAAAGPKARKARRVSFVPDEGLNPYWKPARDAYAGPIQNRKAMELGEKMAGDEADDIGNRMAELPGSQGDFFRLGHRSGLVPLVKSVGDWGNAAAKVRGSLSKRESLAAAHGDRAEGLLDRSDAEHEAHQTYKAVRGNSQSLDRAAEMAAQDQQIEDAARGVLQAIAGNPGVGISAAFKALGNGDRRAAEVKGHISKILAETDDDSIALAMRGLYRERARQSVVSRNAASATQRSSRFLGDVMGTNIIAPFDDQP